MGDVLTINYGYCANDSLTCHITIAAMTTWVPAMLAALIASFLTVRRYWRQQSHRNTHVLHALWEETRTVCFDCQQWIDYNSILSAKRRAQTEPGYRPYTVAFVTSRRNVEALISDMPGINPELARCGFRFHYRDTIAIEFTNAVISDRWTTLAEDQKLFALDDLDMAIRELRIAAKELHYKLAELLGVQPDENVMRNTVPIGFH
ncbi:hypothetical protein [Mesorhizobium australicum]|jgi:hypothetical protein|uniref:Uncharacterized protein n=1 Tax=Mesorhizobium australicum TaxID=536018 RepID=A0A1X7PGS5_9HYPH|nr:hypothetical protein [Mesorhizobium australicum]SMH50714.1 hypothetical protein SAMN02982922_4250 [Mesorhizobium australicum]